MSKELNDLRTIGIGADGLKSGHLGAVGLQGHIDAIEMGRIYGWAWNPEAPREHISVEITHKGAVVGRAIADRFRQDLADLKMSDGTHAFVFDLPKEIRDSDPASLSAYFSESQVPLSRGGTQRLPVPRPDPDIADLLSGRIDRMEASLQQVFRAMHFFRNREDDLQQRTFPADQDDVRIRVDALNDQIRSILPCVDKLQEDTNRTHSLLERIELDLHSRPLRSDVDTLIRALQFRTTFMVLASLLSGLIFLATLLSYLSDATL